MNNYLVIINYDKSQKSIGLRLADNIQLEELLPYEGAATAVHHPAGADIQKPKSLTLDPGAVVGFVPPASGVTFSAFPIDGICIQSRGKNPPMPPPPRPEFRFQNMSEDDFKESFKKSYGLGGV